MLRLLLGVRDDLELETRWWHRLARVALILSAMCIGAAGWWAAQQLSEPHPHVGNIQYVSLEDFRHRQPKEATNITGQFGALPGTLGLLQEDGSVRELWLSELQRDLYCSQDIYAHIGEYVDWERGHKGPTDPDPTVDTATAELQTMGLKLGESTCLGPASSKIPSVRRAIKWTYTTSTLAAWQARSVLSGIATAFVWVVLMANAYYRGLIYIAFGGRKQSAVRT